MSDIQALVSQMTLEEKAALCTGATAWTTTPVPRLNIPSMWVADGPHGVRKVKDGALMAGSYPATCFPTASSMACTWDVELLREVGQALGDECNALGVSVLLGPGANMKRTPLCGRNFEYYSEDPYLAGKMVASFINGVQSRGVGTSLKHYAANNQEYQRFTISANVDERTMREIYLCAFEMAVKEAHPWTLMCAYNKLNGTYCSEHHWLLTEVLKTEWGFEGLVMSDWGAVHDRVKALQGGLDLEMPGPQDTRVKAVVDAVRNGTLDEAVVDESARRILSIVMRAAVTPKGDDFDAAAHHTLARRVAAEGMVLLKNNGILPLQNPQRIAVIGHSAKAPHYQGGGSSHMNPTQVDAPYDELVKKLPQAQFSYSEGYLEKPGMDAALIADAVTQAREADVALLFIALPTYVESEGYDRADLNLTPQQVALMKAVGAAQPNTVIILNNGSALAMSEWIDGTAAVLEAWMMGQAGGGAIADVLVGEVNPGGKLAETFPVKLSDTPAHINYPGDSGEVRYGEGLYIGYRYYDAKQMPVLFPFGYGMSYTTFAYSNVRVSSAAFDDVDGLTVSVDVTNTGAVAGKEVVQVYVHEHKAKVTRPHKELKGFAKVALQPGEMKTVVVALDWRAFAYYHPAYRRWITEEGEFDILVGASSADIRGAQTVTLRSTMNLPCLLNRDSTLREWMEDKRGKPIVEQMVQRMRANVGIEKEEQSSQGLDLMTMLADTSLLGILSWQTHGWQQSPEEIVDEMLRQVHAVDT